MQYQLSKQQILKAKGIIKRLQAERQVWITAKEESEKHLEKSPSKYKANIKSNIKIAEDKIKFFDQKIAEFEQAIKEQHITI